MTGSTISIRPLDLHSASAAEWAAFHQFRRIRHADSCRDEPLLPDAAVEASRRKRSHYWQHVGWAAWEDTGGGERIVGYIYADLPDVNHPEMASNGNEMFVHGSVCKEFRRRGIGTRLLAEVGTLAATAGRSLVTSTTEQEDGHAFLRHFGGEEKMRYEENHLRLDRVDWTMVERWYAALPADLSLTTYAGRVPMTAFERMLPAINAMIADIPRDRMSIPVIENSASMIEDWYARIGQQDGRHHLLALTDANGELAAMADLLWFPDTPDRAGHNLMGVRRDRRGQGLGKAIKAAALLHVRKSLPTVELMTTGNNQVNAPMLAINRQLGFFTHRSGGFYEIAADALPRE